MKLAMYHDVRFGLLVLLMLNGGVKLGAQSPDRPRGNAIIFSAPKSDTVSSNLNELRPPNSPFREMESTLKKPFEMFEPNKPGQSSYPALRGMPAPRQPEVKRKTEKEMLNQRAEEMFLEPGLHAGETDDDLYNSNDRLGDPSGQKPKTALDRYYDRVDRVMTNRAAAGDSQGNDRDARTGLEASIENPFGENGSWDRQRNPFDNRSRPLSAPNANNRNGFFGDADRNFGSQSDANLPQKPGPDYGGFQQPKTDRLDAFKQLLGGSSAARPAAPRANYNFTPAPARATVTPPAFSGGFSGASTFADPADNFTKSAGLIGAPGKPQGLPEYTATSASLNGAASGNAVKPVQVPTFNIPKRRF